MKTVKILSLTLLMSVFCAGMTFAQQQDQNHNRQQKEQRDRDGQKATQKQGQQSKATAEERASKQVEMMKKSLDLNNDQVSKLQAVQTQFIKDQDQARTSKKGNSNQQDLKAKREAYDSQVKSILTPEQYQKYQDMKKGGAKKGQGQKRVNKDGNQDNQGKWSKEKRAEQDKNK